MEHERQEDTAALALHNTESDGLTIKAGSHLSNSFEQGYSRKAVLNEPFGNVL